MLRLMRKGQSTAEYAIVIGLVIAAAVAMQIYVKRSLQAKVKDAVDYNDPAATMLSTSQYEPYYLSSDMTNTRKESTTAATTTGGGVTRTINEDEANRTGTQNISAVE
ncbi:MAG: hypothetical protein PHC37_02565 [Candidatus Omnitrophica bacterium]|nr:hypothetical protein [Candidatus Omnitrophota bacterium]MDD5690570.1 hypothetical protein [Candidatus Omnitrophota bacterium]